MTAQEIQKRANSNYTLDSEKEVKDPNIGFNPILESMDVAYNKDDLGSSKDLIRRTGVQTNDLGLSKTNDIDQQTNSLGLSAAFNRLIIGDDDKISNKTVSRNTSPLLNHESVQTA